MARIPLGQSLPDFPWNSLAGAKKKAQAHPDGIVDLSVGNPVDPVAPGVQLALSSAAEAPGYPQTQGTPELREAIASALRRRYHMDVDRVLPVVGTKEAIAWLPTLLGMRGETVAFPSVAYPTYEVGALLAGATPLRADDDFQDASLVFINLPIAATGGIFALTLRGLPFSIAASIGFIALFGVAILNGVVLVSQIRALQEAGIDAATAAFEAARARFRPVIATASVASLGFFPMAFSGSMGAEVERPLATVVIGGLVTSTLLTLLVLPTLYASLFRKR